MLSFQFGSEFASPPYEVFFSMISSNNTCRITNFQSLRTLRARALCPAAPYFLYIHIKYGCLQGTVRWEIPPSVFSSSQKSNPWPWPKGWQNFDSPGSLIPRGVWYPGESVFSNLNVKITEWNLNKNHEFFNPMVSGPGRFIWWKNWRLKILLDCPFNV